MKMAGLLTDSRSDTFPVQLTSGKSNCRNVEWSFTAAGLFGTFTRFPFNPLPVCLGSRNQFDGKDRAFSVRTKQEGRRFFATSFPARINTFVRTCRYRRTDTSPRACGHVRTVLRTRPYERGDRSAPQAASAGRKFVRLFRRHPSEQKKVTRKGTLKSTTMPW